MTDNIADLLVPIGQGPFRPFDWPALTQRINACPPERHANLRRVALLAWADHLAAELNASFADPLSRPPRYRIEQSDHFILVAALPPSAAAKWPPFAEWVVEAVFPFLAPIAQLPTWPTVLLFAHDVPTFDAYLRAASRHEGLLPGGAYLHSPAHLPHIALLASLEPLHMRLILTHEIIHALIHHRQMPLWLEEGLCRHLEMEQLRMHNLIFLPHVDLARNLHWRNRGLGDFWSGLSFRGEGNSESYVLATRMVRRLLTQEKDTTRFFNFVRNARREDAGNAALEKFYNRPLPSLAAELLGHGDWAPPTATISVPPEPAP